MSTTSSLGPLGDLKIPKTEGGDKKNVITEQDDISKIHELGKTSDDNKNGAKLWLTKAGVANFTSIKHSVTVTPDGWTLVQDKKAGSDKNPKLNFMIGPPTREGGAPILYTRNANYDPKDPKAGPEWIQMPMSKDDTRIHLEGGMDLFIQPNGSTYDVTIVDMEDKDAKEQAKAGADPMNGVKAVLTGVGSGVPFTKGAENNSADVNTGKKFVEDWEKSHVTDGGTKGAGKGGDPRVLYSRSMYAPTEHDSKDAFQRRTYGKDGDIDVDARQAPGGMSMRSKDRFDTNARAGKDKQLLFHDIRPPGKSAKDYSDERDKYNKEDFTDAQWNKKATMNDFGVTDPTALSLINGYAAGNPVFLNSDEPSHKGKTPLIGDGTIANPGTGGATDRTASSMLAEGNKKNAEANAKNGSTTSEAKPAQTGTSFISWLMDDSEAARRRELLRNQDQA